MTDPGRKIFVAIPTGEDLQHQVEAWRKKHADLPVRWVPEENLHITLLAPWFTSDVEKFRTKFSSWHADTAPIPVEFTAVESAPKDHPRLIWASGTAPKQLLHLLEDLRTQLSPPVERKKRPFRLHLTIARFVRDSGSMSVSETVRWPETMRRVVLTESLTKPLGVIYEPLVSVNLKTESSIHLPA